MNDLASRTHMANASPSLLSMLFECKQDWAAWLDKNHGESPGLWLQLAKKGSKRKSVTYREALDVALCYGWIDAQKRAFNDDVWLQRFLPRSPKSLWSKTNREKALALIASGQMSAAGLKAINNAKQSGQWENAYDAPSKAAVPGDLQAALDASPKAKKFFNTLDKANRYAILWRIQTTKRPETRARKIEQFIDMLKRQERIHPRDTQHSSEA